MKTDAANPSSHFDGLIPDRRHELNRNEMLMWLTQQRVPTLPCFNMPFTFAISGPIQPDEFRRAFLNVVARHESLRLVIRESNGTPKRWIADAVPVDLPFIDFSQERDPTTAFASWIQQRKIIPVPLHERQFDAALARLGHDRFVWFLNVHHILVDGWSFSQIYRWIRGEYQALTTRDPSPASESGASESNPVPSRRPPSPRARARAHEYWTAKSRRTFDELQLYGLSRKPDEYRERRLSRTLTTAQLELLDILARRPPWVSLNIHLARLTILCTVMFAHLSRVSGARSLRIGVPIHFRQTDNQDIGLLHVTCPVDVEVDDGDTFRTLSAKVADELWNLIRHGQAHIDESVYRGYDVIINYPNVSFPPIAGWPTRTQWEHSGYGDGHRSLFLQAVDFDGAGVLTLHFDVNESVFDNSQHERAIDHFMTLFDAMLEDPAAAVLDVDLLSPAERQRVVVDFNQTDMNVPRDLVLGNLFRNQVSKSPDDCALIFGRRQLTYAELEVYSNRVAHMLRTMDAGPGVRVAVCARRSVELIAAILGIFKAGATYVPLDPLNPPERLKFLLDDCAAPILLVHEEWRHRLPEFSGRTVLLDNLEGTAARFPATPPNESVRQADPAYVIYTSGSTGRPKGVVLSQRVLINLVTWQIQRGTRLSKPRTLQFTPLTFDVSLQETLACWASGGTLIAISDEDRRDPEATLRLICDQHVEQLFIIFTPLQQLAEAADRTGLVPTSLREVITAGERVQMTPALRRFFERMPNCTFQNQYGPSETHIVTACELTGPPRSWPALPSIGRPVANTQIYILDARLRPMPLSVVGELYIGGAQVADGYLNRPDLTAERFLPDPFSTDPTARMYRSGDLGRFLPDGNIHFLGRQDFQTKIRGYRIELGEIEAALSAHPGVRDCVAMAREDVPGEKRLVAYVVGRDVPSVLVHAAAAPLDPRSMGIQFRGNEADNARVFAEHRAVDCRATPDLRRFLQSKLPEAMLPSAFVYLSALPQTPNGKINRLALPPPPDVRPELDAEFVAPSTELQQAVADIWCQVLGLDRVGLHDDFFALGGDSLKLVHVHTLLHERLNCPLSITDLFAYSTVQRLADRMA